MKEHAIVSPSAAHRWLNCTRAPQLEATLPRKTSIYAEEGTLAHRVCEIAAKVRFYKAENAEFQKTVEQLRKDPLWDDEMLRTAGLYVAYLADRAAYYHHNPKVAFEAKVDISEYAPEAFGRCDCIMLCGNTLVIADYKHGKGVPVSATKNPQMMLYALGALNLWEKTELIKQVEISIVQPRIDFFGKWKCTVDELLAWGESIKSTAKMAYEGKGEFNAGKWCRFCRAKGICEATREGAAE